MCVFFKNYIECKCNNDCIITKFEKYGAIPSSFSFPWHFNLMFRKHSNVHNIFFFNMVEYYVNVSSISQYTVAQTYEKRQTYQMTSHWHPLTWGRRSCRAVLWKHYELFTHVIISWYHASCNSAIQDPTELLCYSI